MRQIQIVSLTTVTTNNFNTNRHNLKLTRLLQLKLSSKCKTDSVLYQFQLSAFCLSVFIYIHKLAQIKTIKSGQKIYVCNLQSNFAVHQQCDIEELFQRLNLYLSLLKLVQTVWSGLRHVVVPNLNSQNKVYSRLKIVCLFQISQMINNFREHNSLNKKKNRNL